MDFGITYIVSAFNRPHMLRCCLASLKAQHSNLDAQILVTDNAVDYECRDEHQAICEDMCVEYLHTGAPSCYHSAEMGAQMADKDYLCFPSDDSYYVPAFAHKMLCAASQNNWDLVYCDMVYELNRLQADGGYGLLTVEPRWTKIDKTGFILRRSRFKEFPNKGMDGLIPAPSVDTCGADGYLIEQLMAEGISHGKVNEILVVHN